MDLKFSRIVNKELKKAEILLYGELGDEPGEIDGHYFARELNWLGREYDEIKMRVNCGGGLITHGLSIFSEMITSQAKITLQVDGIAASMGAIFIAAADYVTILDYARIMLHSPYFIDEKNDKRKASLSKSELKAIGTLRSMLVAMLAKRGIAEDDVDKMLTTSDNWFTAEEAITAKLADEKVVTGKLKEMAQLDVTHLAAKINETINPKNSDMKQLIAKFQLPADADEAAVMTAVNQLETDHSTAVNKLNDVNKKLVDKLIAVGRIANVINDDNEASFRKLSAADPDLFVSMVNVKKEDLAGHQTRLSEFIDRLESATGDGKKPAADEKDWDWYQRNDPAALAKLEVTDKVKFDKLRSAYEAKLV